MIILDTTTKSLEFRLSGAVGATQLPFTSFYVDHTTSAYTPGEADGASNNATAITLVAAPAASTHRSVKTLNIYNADNTTATVTIQLNNNGTIRTLLVVTLSVADTLIYTDVNGWEVINTSGQKKSIASVTSLPALAAGTNLIGRVASSNETTTIYSGTTALVPKSTAIGVASSGNNALVTAVSGKIIRVLAMMLMSTGTVNIYFTSGAGGTVIWGGSTNKINLIANVGYVLPYSPVGWFWNVSTNQDITVNLSGAVGVSGGLVYIEV